MRSLRLLLSLKGSTPQKKCFSSVSLDTMYASCGSLIVEPPSEDFDADVALGGEDGLFEPTALSFLGHEDDEPLYVYFDDDEEDHQHNPYQSQGHSCADATSMSLRDRAWTLNVLNQTGTIPCILFYIRGSESSYYRLQGGEALHHLRLLLDDEQPSEFYMETSGGITKYQGAAIETAMYLYVKRLVEEYYKVVWQQAGTNSYRQRFWKKRNHKVEI